MMMPKDISRIEGLLADARRALTLASDVLFEIKIGAIPREQHEPARSYHSGSEFRPISPMHDSGVMKPSRANNNNRRRHR